MRRPYFKIHPTSDVQREGIPESEGALFRRVSTHRIGLERIRSVRTGKVWAWSGGGAVLYGPELADAIEAELAAASALALEASR